MFVPAKVVTPENVGTIELFGTALVRINMISANS